MKTKTSYIMIVNSVIYTEAEFNETFTDFGNFNWALFKPADIVYTAEGDLRITEKRSINNNCIIVMENYNENA